MKKFRFVFTRLILLTIISCISLAAVALTVNIIKLIRDDFTLIYYKISCIFMIVMCAAVFIIVIALIISSNYVFEEKLLKIKFGFLSNKIGYDKITTVYKLSKAQKLIIYFDKGRHMFICIKKESYDAFTETLLKHNKNILYDIKNEEEL